MGVINPYAGISAGQERSTEELKRISEKLSKLIPAPVMMRHAIGNGVELFSKGKMVWWTKVDLAARYRIKLAIKTEDRLYEIAILENDREKLYATFSDIPAEVTCQVKLEAESRDGTIIASAEILM